MASQSEFQEALAKIRPHVSSNLPHQKTPALLLQAMESSFPERTPTAYFAALLTTLEAALRQEGPHTYGDGDRIPAIIYLQALIAPYAPTPVLRAHLTTLLSLHAPLFPELESHAPALRSQLALFAPIFQALDQSQLEVQGIRQCFATCLVFLTDGRPKVRKRASETIRAALENPPSPLTRHPYGERVVSWAEEALKEPDSAIHVVAALKSLVPFLNPDSLTLLSSKLLMLPTLGNPFLSQAAYGLLAELEVDASSLVPSLLSAAPSKFDSALSAAWVSVFANMKLDSEPLWKAWKVLWTYLESENPSLRRTTGASLSQMAQNISKESRKRVIGLLESSFESLAYAQAIPEILAVLSSVVLASPDSQDMMLPLIARVSEMRTRKAFQHKETADAVLASAMRVYGPETILATLPLNLEPEDRTKGKEPRAYLLPLLPGPHPSPLKHFVNYFVPLSERMFELKTKAGDEGRDSEAKVWSVLIAQIWAGLGGYCWGSKDLPEALTPQFAQLVSNILYTQPELRPSVLRALKTMAESNMTLASSGSEDEDLDMEGTKKPSSPAVPFGPISPEIAKKNLAFLRKQAESWFAVLFNVFGTVEKESRGMVGEVISAWATMTKDKELAGAYRKVVLLFKQNLPKAESMQKNSNAPNESAAAVQTTQDILLLLLPHLPAKEAASLFDLCLTPEILASKDAGVQKRGYRIVAKLMDSGKVTLDGTRVENSFKLLIEATEKVGAAAKRDRYIFLNALVQQLPTTSLHLILSLIPEAVLGTKEPADRTRAAAFDLLVAMGRKMSEGGVITNSLVDGMEVEDSDAAGNERQASIEEYITMVAAGLAGASPHMISASITAIGRVVFEFHRDVSDTTLTEILQTLIVLLTSANREIVKSTLGFVKLAIHTLPIPLVQAQLPNLVPPLLGWSHDHKNHFKIKVRHIFERLIRRFGFDAVYACVGPDDQERGKVLLSVKKRKEQSKKKKAKQRAEGDEEEPDAPRPSGTGDAFEDVLYGSEEEDSEDSEMEDTAAVNKPSKQKGGTRLKADGDLPLDLLKGAGDHIASASSKRQRKPGRDASKFKTDDAGKMIVDEDDSDAEDIAASRDIEGNAYRESLTSVDGFTRGPNGRVKFNKDTKKRRRANEDADSDVDMADASTSNRSLQKSKKQKVTKIGKEFKAKNAGGDVKRGGTDPYAYLPLGQTAKRRKGGSKISIVGKK
ncbi:NUC173-domain-containing protein [Sistotremastrum niveocremeum HHB9708]|uniref:NUC173-domain-containing protein n=1 Tax=Sistotremastrum niveocremeum HHB9708 TaxID=1314777 RepID=A0A164ZZE7_9AGAM|nr:NUC173-domain-containing protein [Sistotremastrum niveocremeum HHB9708]